MFGCCSRAAARASRLKRVERLLARQQRRRDGLERDEAVEDRVVGPVDRAHRALAELGQDLEFSEVQVGPYDTAASSSAPKALAAPAPQALDLPERRGVARAPPRARRSISRCGRTTEASSPSSAPFSVRHALRRSTRRSCRVGHDRARRARHQRQLRLRERLRALDRGQDVAGLAGEPLAARRARRAAPLARRRELREPEQALVAEDLEGRGVRLLRAALAPGVELAQRRERARREAPRALDRRGRRRDRGGARAARARPRRRTPRAATRGGRPPAAAPRAARAARRGAGRRRARRPPAAA